MLKKKGPINMSIKLVQITWMEGRVIMQPWIIGITTLQMENNSSSCVLIYRAYIIIIHIKVNEFLSLCSGVQMYPGKCAKHYPSLHMVPLNHHL